MFFRKTKYISSLILISSLYYFSVNFNGSLKASYGKTIKNNFDQNLKENIKTDYILGPGDVIFINFNNLKEFSKNYIIDNEGQVFLPELNKVKVSGLTVNELKTILQDEYEEYIINPKIDIFMADFRTLSVYIGGEINRPGLYKLDYENSSTIKKNESIGDLKNNQSPRLFDALSMANGLTNRADLENIEIIRLNSITQGGGKIKANINLLALLSNGDQTQNIKIFDGDYIYINKSTTPINEQLFNLNSNLNPEKITVFINGNVYNPGRVEINPNSSLQEALATAGGSRPLSGKISFVRLLKEGKSDKRIFNYKFGEMKGSYKNPILLDGDIVYLNKNLLGKITGTLDDIATPLIITNGIFNIFE